MTIIPDLADFSTLAEDDLLAADDTSASETKKIEAADLHRFLDGAVRVTGDNSTRSTRATAVQSAIDDAASAGLAYVYVPKPFFNYDASAVTFNSAVMMVREGGSPWAFDVIAYGAAGDDSADDTAAIQAALTQGAGRRIIVPVPDTAYKITATLTVEGNNTTVEGESLDAIIRWDSGTSGSTMLSGGSSVRVECNIKSLEIDANDVASVKCLDFTHFSYSLFEHLFLSAQGNNTVGAYAQGTEAGSSPYYNTFLACHLSSDNVTSTSGSIGYHYDLFTTSGGSLRGPNACHVIGGRVSGFDENVRVEAGNNLSFAVFSESAVNYHFRFENTTADETGTATSGGIDTLTDSGASFDTTLAVNGGIEITGGTGSGQKRRIESATSTQITVRHPWATKPDATSTYEVYYPTILDVAVRDSRAEGSASDNPDVIRKGLSARGIAASNIHAASNGSGSLWNADTWDQKDDAAFAGYKSLVAYSFYYENPGTGLSGEPMHALSANTDEYHLPYDADVVLITITSSADRSGGTLTATPTFNGVDMSFNTVLNADKTNNYTRSQALGVEGMGGDDRRLGVKLDTDGSWAPTTADIVVTVYVVPKT